VSDPGVLLASGRAADVYDLGNSKVLRRYRTSHDVAIEGDLMSFLFSAGYPVPQVYEARGRDLVMDLVDGPTMLDDLDRRPWRIEAHIKTLATLQRDLGSIAAPDWLPAEDRIPPGGSILHLDLHPMNVMLSERGPVVIDWTNARKGHEDFDAALTYVLAASFEPTGWKEALGVRLMLRRFLHHRGVAAVDRWWVEAVDYRSSDPNVTSGEAAKLESLRYGRPRS
jgi:tRNA A-37 threonylcarbamoyl transferase component Bud32